MKHLHRMLNIIQDSPPLQTIRVVKLPALEHLLESLQETLTVLMAKMGQQVDWEVVTPP